MKYTYKAQTYSLLKNKNDLHLQKHVKEFKEIIWKFRVFFKVILNVVIVKATYYSYKAIKIRNNYKLVLNNNLNY